MRTPRKQRSVEAVKAKRENFERNRHQSAESGDDEDEELGDVQVRARSPQGKLRGSKLGTEMMRTNSRGSITSGPDDSFGSKNEILPSIVSRAGLEDTKVPQHTSRGLTPPEIFPRHAAGEAVKEIDMDATPKPSTLFSKIKVRDMQVDPLSPSPP